MPRVWKFDQVRTAANSSSILKDSKPFDCSVFTSLSNKKNAMRKEETGETIHHFSWLWAYRHVVFLTVPLEEVTSLHVTSSFAKSGLARSPRIIFSGCALSEQEMDEDTRGTPCQQTCDKEKDRERERERAPLIFL